GGRALVARRVLESFASLRQLDSMPLHQPADEVLVPLRNTLGQRAHAHALFALDREVFRDQHVDAVGLAVDVLIDPFQLTLELIRGEYGDSENAETPRSADGGDHVATMA